MQPHRYANFQNVDPDGRIRMNAVDTLEDLARLRLSLSDGLAVELYTDEAIPTAGHRSRPPSNSIHPKGYGPPSPIGLS